jgi:hypothetical protein
MKSFTVLGAFLVFTASSSGQGSEEKAAVLGHLAIQGVVGIHAGPGDIEVSAPSYPYRAGERVSAREHSSAVPTLRDGSISIAPETSVSVTGEGSRYRIDLETGALRLRFGEATAFELASGEVRMRFPTADAQASGARGPVDVMIAVGEDGVVAADAYQGAVELSRVAGGAPRVVAAGEREVFHLGNAPVSAEGERELRETLAPWLIGTGSVVGAGGIGTGIYYLVDDDDDDDDDASPVR